ncbi:MAG TPA: hypothetical protein VMU62_05835 [Acidobacteriaceae bacterium]|nr:hypothetical protein [Acidobacteriaceae bacterium]
MKCYKLKSFLPDLVFDPASVPSAVQNHLRVCTTCRAEVEALQGEMQSTLRLLDDWKAPEPSPYFDVRMAARLHEARQAEPDGFLERIRQRLSYGSPQHLRPAMAAALALVMIVGGGSYAGFFSLHGQPAVTSATVHDLQLLDANDATIQQLNAFDDDSDSGSTADSSMMQ